MDMFIPDIFQMMMVGLWLLVPVCAIYARAGFSPLWAGLVFLPGFGFLLIFLHLALFPWPKLDKQQEKPLWKL